MVNLVVSDERALRITDANTDGAVKFRTDVVDVIIADAIVASNLVADCIGQSDVAKFHAVAGSVRENAAFDDVRLRTVAEVKAGGAEMNESAMKKLDVTV